MHDPAVRAVLFNQRARGLRGLRGRGRLRRGRHGLPDPFLPAAEQHVAALDVELVVAVHDDVAVVDLAVINAVDTPVPLIRLVCRMHVEDTLHAQHRLAVLGRIDVLAVHGRLAGCRIDRLFEPHHGSAQCSDWRRTLIGGRLQARAIGNAHDCILPRDEPCADWVGGLGKARRERHEYQREGSRLQCHCGDRASYAEISSMNEGDASDAIALCWAPNDIAGLNSTQKPMTRS